MQYKPRPGDLGGITRPQSYSMWEKNVSSNQILHKPVFENNQSANPRRGDFWREVSGGRGAAGVGATSTKTLCQGTHRCRLAGTQNIPKNNPRCDPGQEIRREKSKVRAWELLLTPFPCQVGGERAQKSSATAARHQLCLLHGQMCSPGLCTRAFGSAFPMKYCWCCSCNIYVTDATSFY